MRKILSFPALLNTATAQADGHLQWRRKKHTHVIILKLKSLRGDIKAMCVHTAQIPYKVCTKHVGIYKQNDDHLPTNMSLNLSHCRLEIQYKPHINNLQEFTEMCVASSSIPSFYSHLVDMKCLPDCRHHHAVRALAVTNQRDVVATEPNGAVRTENLAGSTRSSHVGPRG